MLRNWLTVAVRNLMRHRLYAAINILGLAVGLAAALLIALFVRHELSYDTMYAEGDRVVRLVRTQFIAGRAPEETASTSSPAAPAMLEAFPREVEAAVRVGRTREVVRTGAETRYQLFHMADPGFFRLFDIPFLAGDPATAIDRPHTVVLTQAAATRLLGTGDALGRTLTLGTGQVLTVTGIIPDMPSNTEFARLEALTSTESALGQWKRTQGEWNWNWLDTWLLLRPATDMAALQAAFPDWLLRVRPDQNEEAPRGEGIAYRLQPLRQVHTHPLPGEDGTSMAVISGLAVLALVILAIAAINFVNLATAQATLRAREVALRKTLGAHRGLVMLQFLGESLLLTLIAGVIAVALVELALPGFQSLLKLRLDAAFHDLASLLGIGAVLVVGLGVLGGLYPAVVLSGFRPAQVLRGGGPGGVGGGQLRAALVITQFAVAIALAVGTLVVLQQTRYAASQQLGFDRENVVLLRGLGNRAAKPRLEALKSRIAADPGVVSVAGAPWVPSDTSETTSTFLRTDGDRAQMTLRSEMVDFGYFETLRTTLLAGRIFDPARPADQLRDIPEGSPPVQGRTASAVISRSALAPFGFGKPEDAVGKTILYPEDEGDVLLTVIGVVDDLQHKSAREPTVPTVYLCLPGAAGTLMVRIRPDAAPAVLDRLDAIWRELVPEVPVWRQFLDDRIDLLYARDLQQGMVFAIFAGLAIIIACLGLFGLAAFTAQRRTREIGIRKVLGAGVPEIIRLLVWQFSRPVLVANLIAWPVAWLALSRWLEGFAYRIELDPLLFLAAGLAALAIAWVTVAGHAFRVASRKPVAALRYE